MEYIDEYEESFYADIEARMKRQKEANDEIEQFFENGNSRPSD